MLEIIFYIKDKEYRTNDGLVSIHHTERTQWIAHINEKLIESFGCPIQIPLSHLIFKKNGEIFFLCESIRG